MRSPLHIGLSHYGRKSFYAADQTYNFVKFFNNPKPAQRLLFLIQSQIPRRF